jgi:hypothetical protein
MKKITCYIVVLIAFLGTVNAQNGIGNLPVITIDQFEENIGKYFLNKNDSIIYEAISIYKNVNYTHMLEDMDQTLVFFFYGIRVDNINKYTNFRNIVSTSGTQGLLNIFIAIENSNIGSFLEHSEPSGALNDIYWTLYSSSGNVQYLDYLLNVVKNHSNETSDMYLYLAASSAIWSLAGNSRIYRQVRTHIDNTRIIDNQIKRYILNTNPDVIKNETVEYVRKYWGRQ